MFDADARVIEAIRLPHPSGPASGLRSKGHMKLKEHMRIAVNIGLKCGGIMQGEQNRCSSTGLAVPAEMLYGELKNPGCIEVCVS